MDDQDMGVGVIIGGLVLCVVAGCVVWLTLLVGGGYYN